MTDTHDPTPALSASALALFLGCPLAEPERAAQILAEHVDDGTGWCRACRWACVAWPCAVVSTLLGEDPLRAADGFAVAVTASGVCEVLTDAR